MELIWITGGAWQGKTDYARSNYGEEWEIRPHYEQTVRRQLLEGKDPMEEARKLPVSYTHLTLPTILRV